MEPEDLLRHEADAWEALLAEARRVPVGRWDEPGVVPGWSIQDLLWHCGRWTEYSAELMDEMTAGVYRNIDFPDEYWQGLNAAWALESKLRTPDDILTGAEIRRMRARQALSALPGNADAVREFSSETFEHYEEHQVEIARFADAGTADGSG